MKKIKIGFLLSITCMLISCAIYFVFITGQANEEEEIQYSIQDEYIVFDKQDLKNKQIIQISDMQHQMIDMENPVYSLTSEESYEFYITYMDEMGESKSYIKVIEIDKQKNTETKLAPKALNAGQELVPDEHFYNYLVNVLGLDPNFTIGDLQSLEGINYTPRTPDAKVKSIQGIEYMSNIKYLYLNDNEVTSLDPMKNTVYPNMKQMEFNNWNDGKNAITDLSILDTNHFPNMSEQVMFNNNQIDDSVFATLPQTNGLIHSHFFFQNNKISDITPLSTYTGLKRLDLRHNNISDLTPLSSLSNIELLYLSDNKIENVEPLKTISMPSGNGYIWLNNNNIIDLSSLQSLDAYIFAEQYNESTEEYPDIETNKGQQFMAPTIFGDKDSGEINVTSIIVDREGNIVPFEVDGKETNTKSVFLDPLTDTSYTYTLEYSDGNTRYMGNVTQHILWWKKPMMEATTIELFEGDEFQEKQNVNAKDADDKDITSEVHVLSNTVDTNKPGTYEVVYEVIDEHNYKNTIKQIVKVHGKPQKISNIVHLNINESTLDNTILIDGEDVYLKAQDAVGSKPIETKIGEDDIRYDASTINSKEEGIYPLTYTMQVNGKEFTKQATVFITKKNILESADGVLLMNAHSFTIENDDAKSLTQQQVQVLSKASAYTLKRDMDGNIKDVQLAKGSVSISKEDMKNIRNVSEKGGIFPVTFTIYEYGQELTKSGYISVLGEDNKQIEDPEGNHFVSSIKEVVLDYDSAKTTTSEDLLRLSKLEVLHEESETLLDTYYIEESELQNIHNVSSYGGEFTLTAYAVFNDSIKIPIEFKVTVETAKKGIILDSEKQEEYFNIHKPSKSIETSDTTTIQSYVLLIIFATCVLALKHYKKERQ